MWQPATKFRQNGTWRLESVCLVRVAKSDLDWHRSKASGKMSDERLWIFSAETTNHPDGW